MKVLLTGASGFLGGHIAEQLVQSGHSARALVRVTSRTGLLEKLGVSIVRGDLTDRASLERAVQGVEVVVHAAATMTGTPQEFEAASIGGTRTLLDVAEQADVQRFVHISSIGILRMAKPPKRAPITEDTPYEDNPAFLGVYNKSKMAAEQAALACGERSEMSVVIIRPGLLYGPRGKWVLPRMGYAVGRKRFLLVGMGWNPLPVSYVRDCAHAAVLAVERTELRENVFNIVDDEPFTQIEYLKRWKKDVRPGLKITRVPYLVARCFGWCCGLGMRLLKRSNPIAKAHLVACVRRLRYSNERAKQILGWRPAGTKKSNLAETMQYFAEAERISRRADLKVLGKPAPDKPPVTAAVVGCGVIAESHLKILGEMENARPVAVCDINKEAARELAQRHKILHVYDDIKEMMEKEKPQVIHILTPPQSHADLATLALEGGAHVLVEKPMGLTAEDSRRMAETAKRCNRFLCVDHNHLYDPVMVRARKMIESGELGDIIWLESYYGFDLGNNRASRYMLPGGGEHWTFKIPGALYQNLAPHPLSVALDVLGRPEKTTVKADPTRVVPYQPTDELRIFLETPKGSGMVVVSLAASPRFQYMKIHGSKMRLTVDLLNKWLIAERVGRGLPKAISRAMMNFKHGMAIVFGTLGSIVKVLRRRWTPYDGMNLLVREFYAAVQEGRTPPVTADEGLMVMEVMDDVWRQIGPIKADESTTES